MKHHIYVKAADLDINLQSKKETEVFKWFIACLLFGKPIQQEIALHAYETITKNGINSIGKLAKTDWNTLVKLLDSAHYVRYDFSTATKLLQISNELKRQYGNLTNLLKESKTVNDLEQKLLSFRGIGPVTASIFISSIAPVWFKEDSSHDLASAEAAASILAQNGFEAFLIGGAVRDLLLGMEPKDFDLVTNAEPDQIMAIPQFTRAVFNDPSQAFGVTRVRMEHHQHKYELEIATFRKDIEAHKGRKATKVKFANLEDDVIRRDFTVNALALDPSTGGVIDYVGGIDDLANRILRFIGNPKERINEDPLRIMRAIRFKNHLGFIYDLDTAISIKRAVKSGYVEDIATDRLREELTALLTHDSRRQAVYELDEFGILGRVLPEVTSGKNVAQPPEFHSEGDVWQHELLILDYLPQNPSPRLAWASLLHDIGKGPTATKPDGEGGRIRFDRHYAVGAEMAKTILRRLNFSNHDTKDIVWMIYNHMAIDDLPSMRPSSRQKMLGHPAFEDLLELHRADAAASWRPGKSHGKKPRFKELEELWHNYQSMSPKKRQPSLKADLGIDGRWLLKNFGKEFNLREGPLIGKVLNELDEWYRDEGIKDKKAYVKKVRQLIQKSL